MGSQRQPPVARGAAAAGGVLQFIDSECWEPGLRSQLRASSGSGPEALYSGETSDGDGPPDAFSSPVAAALFSAC